jgi:hypothetical protein
VVAFFRRRSRGRGTKPYERQLADARAAFRKYWGVWPEDVDDAEDEAAMIRLMQAEAAEIRKAAR